MPQFDLRKAEVRFAYKAISLQIREIFAANTPIIEPLSLDEGYLDWDEPAAQYGSSNFLFRAT